MDQSAPRDPELPLAGVRVLSLTHYLQGPSCVQFLADLGADVIKVERPGGAYERHWSGAQSFVGQDSVFFLCAGRNQRSIELNLRTPEAVDIMWQLIDRADVLVENFRPGVLDRLGFSCDAVRARNPRIVYCALTGFGPAGPQHRRPGQDMLAQARSGLVALTGRGDEPPSPVGTAVVDQHAATLGALGVLAALLRRERTGTGCRVDSNLLSAGLDLQLEPLNYHLNGTRLWDRSPSGVASRFHQAPYGVFETADGYLALSMAEGPTLARAFDDPWFADLTREDQFTRREEVNAKVAELLRARTTAEWEDILDREGVWNERLREYDEVLADPQVEANQSILELPLGSGETARVSAHPVLYDGQVPPVRLRPPGVGEHTDEVLGELGLDEEAIARLRHDGAIGVDRRVHPFDRHAESPPSSYSKRTQDASG